MFASRKILFFSYALALACFFFFPKLSFACFTSSTYNAWGYCRAITINQTWVASSTGSEAYTNFPVLFSEASDSNLVAHALSTGNDILFLGSDDATKLNDEIEHYTSSTGEIEAWVNMSSISTSSNTVFYMYYGNSGASNQQNVTGTWNSNYQLVDHLGSNSGNLNVNDSTSNADNGTSSTAIATTTGEIDGAASFNGSQEYQLTTPIVDQTTSSFTFSTWVYTMASNTSASLLGVESGSGPSHGGFFIKPNVNGIYVDYLKVIHPGSYLYSDAFSSSSLSINAWHLVDFVNTLGTLRFYIDGALDVNTSVGLGINLSLKDIGDDSLADNLQGKLDELRYANTARSADWVKTEWNNQSAPSSFYTIGSQQNDYHITTSPTALSNNHSGQITLTLTGLGTSWVQGSTIFSLSGVSNITKVSQNITTSTAATIVVTTGIGTGTLTISDGTGSVSVAVSPETLSVFPTSTNIFATTTLTFTGVNTAWNQETSSTLFSVSGVSGASLGTPTITGNGAATALLTLGTTQGTLTITDNSTGATTTILAGPPTIPASSTYILLSEPGAEYSTLVGHNLYVNMLGYPYPEGQYLINTQTNTSTFINSDGGLGIDQNYTTLVGTNLYTVNSDVNTLQVLNTLTNTLMTTITGVGSEYNTILGLLNSENLVGTNLYVLNTYTPLGTVSVINTLNNSVAATITVGSDPRYATVVGTNLYVNNAGTSTVSVINTLNNSVAATIPVGSNPLWSTLVGTNLYVNNSGTSTVSVINTLNNSVTATIPVGSQPQFSSLVGSNLYVFNKGSSTVSVINTLNNSVAATIPVGSSGQYNLQPPILVGTNLYVINEGSNNISVINTLTNTLAATISITGGTQPVLATPVGSNLYVSDYNGAGNPGIATSTVSVIDTLTNRIMDVSAPVLTSFTSASVNGTYTMGQSVNITANFGEALGASSTMTVTLNTGATVTLNTVSGSTLSGTYVVGSGDTPVPELNVARVVGAFVPNVSKTDMGVSYALPPHPQITGQANGNIGDNSNISIAKDYFTIPVGTSPAQIASVGSVLYIANEGSNTVSAFDTNTNIFLGTISVGSEPYGIAYNASSSEIYVSNSGTSTVSVIDANSADGNYNKVIYTIPVGAQPYGIATVGMNVYVANNLSNTVSVITTGNHMVTSTISVGDAPFGVAALGTKIYVTNSNIQQNANSLGEGGSVSVIDANPSDGSYNTVINTIMVGTDPQGVVASGAFVYVSNFIDDTVSLINANTNAVSSTIIVGNGPNGILALGSSVYVENSNDSTISVVGVASSTVSTTIPAGNVPAGMAAVGNNIYLTRFTDGEISVLDTTDNDMVTPATSTPPQSLTAIPGNAQVSLSWSAPSSTGGASLTQYLVYDRFTGSSTFSQIATTSLSVTSSTITSLTNGQSYDFEVIAQNAVGSSTPSNMVSSTPTTIPSAPTVLSGVSGNGQVSLSFTPGSNGGSAILYYTATSNPGNLSASSTGSPIVVTGLINTQGYTFTVTATNINGSSLSSLASASITPAAPIANVGVASGGNYVSAGTQNPTSTVMNSTSSTILTSSSTTITTQTTASLETQLQSLLTQLYALESQAGMPSSNTMTGTISPHSPSSCTPIPIIATKDASYPFTRDLSYNDRGADVLALQQFLIDQNAGPSARSLAQVGATGLFVNKTLLALKEFQTSVCINATGYFGSITRRYLGR